MRAVLYILFFIPFTLCAQNLQKVSELFCTNDYEGQQMIRVKWLYNTVYNPVGMDIYRQEKDATEWTKLNAEPILPVKSLPANHKLDKEAQGYHNMLIKTPFEEFGKNPVRAFVLIKALYSDELAGYIGIRWLDTKVEKGKEYIYKISLSGTTNEIGKSRSIVCAAYSKPAPPENAKLTRFKKHIDISWKPDIYRYYSVDIYKKSAQETSYTKITKIPRAIQKDQAEKYSEKSVYYQDTAIVYEANYTYRFVAIDYFGQASEMSPEFSVPSQDFIPPTMPFNVTPTASSLTGIVTLEWKLVDEKDLAGANIYTTTSLDKEFTKVNTEVIPKTQLTFNHKSQGVGSHYYKIASVDLSGNQTYSAPVFIEVKDVTPPAKPQGLKSESGEGFITLKWNANTERDLRGYHVQRSLKSKSKINDSYVNVTKEPIVQTTYTEQLPINVRNEFVYRIVAIDSSFNRSIPSENTLARMPDATPPLQPVIKNIVSDSVKTVITWLPNVDVDIAGYNLYRSLNNDTIAIVKVNFNTIPSVASSYTDRETKPGTGYNYFLEAVDSSGNKSKRTSAFYAKTQAPKVKGNIRIDTKKYNAKKGVLMLEWKVEASEEAQGVVVYRQISAELPFKPITGLIKEDNVDVPMNEKTNGVFQVRCYTVSGKIIQSENFTINQ